jgi:hypothetical protein
MKRVLTMHTREEGGREEGGRAKEERGREEGRKEEGRKEDLSIGKHGSLYE